MKVFVMTDLEGACGVVARPGNHKHEILNYTEAGELLTAEVNACADGLLQAGVKEIVAIDGHGSGNAFSHHRLHKSVSAGSLGGVMFPRSFGLGPDFDAAIQLGTHAMNGREGFLNHTFSSGMLAEMRLNGEVIGEVGIEIMLAAYFGVPTVMISGDETSCREAFDFLGFEIPSVVTKKTPWRFTAINRPAGEVYAELTETARYAMKILPEIPVKKMKPGFEITVRWMSINTADECERRGAERIDNETVRWCDNDFLEVWAQQQGWAPGVHSRRFPELHAAGVWK